MTLLTVFNNALKGVAVASKELENEIANDDFWSDEKKTIAVTLIRQIREGYMLKPYQSKKKELLKFKDLILVYKREAIEEIDSVASLHVSRNIEKVVDDINKISPIIKFSYEGFEETSTNITYSVSWEI